MTSDIIKIRALSKYMTQHRAHWYTFCHPSPQSPRARRIWDSYPQFNSRNMRHFLSFLAFPYNLKTLS